MAAGRPSGSDVDSAAHPALLGDALLQPEPAVQRSEGHDRANARRSHVAPAHDPGIVIAALGHFGVGVLLLFAVSARARASVN